MSRCATGGRDARSTPRPRDPREGSAGARTRNENPEEDHGLEARAAARHDGRRRRHRRHRGGAPPRAAGLHHEPDAAAEGRERPGLCPPRRGGARLGPLPRRGAGGGGLGRVRPAGRLLRDRARRHRAGPRLDRGRRGPLLRHGGERRQGPCADRRLRRPRRRAREDPDQARRDLGGHPRRRDPPGRGHRLQPHPPVLDRAGGGLRRGRRVPDLALRRAHPRLARQGRRRPLRGRDRSRRRLGAPNLRLLQDPRYRDGGDGRPPFAMRARSRRWPAATG